MNYWWVNHGGSFDNENRDSYLAAPKTGRVFWENVGRAKKGDYIFSYAAKYIRSVGIVTDDPIIAPNPNIPNEKRPTWFLKVSWTNLIVPFRTMKIWDKTKNMFSKCRNAPLTETGKGCQGYLYQITKEIFITYLNYMGKNCNTDLSKFNIDNILLSTNYEENISDATNTEDGIADDEVAIDETDTADEESGNITYEKDLQDALVKQIQAGKLFNGYKIFGPNNKGVEYYIDGKRIDILLEKNNEDELLAIELKAGFANKDVFGQISMYIGMLMDNFPNKEIKGYIIAGEIDDTLKKACRTNPNIKLMTYRMELILNDAQ